MKRLIRALTLLYPSKWRRRYADEFLCFIDELNPGGKDVLDVLKGGIATRVTSVNFIAMVLLFGALGVSLAALPAIRLPDLFWSSTTFTVYNPADLSPSMNEVDPVRMQRIIDTYDLYKFTVQWYGPYPSANRRPTSSEKLKAFRGAIRVERLSQGSFRITFRYSDPTLAAQVTNQLASAFLYLNLKRPPGKPEARAVILDPARVPERASSPNRGAILAWGLVGGAAFGICVAFVRGSHPLAAA